MPNYKIIEGKRKYYKNYVSEGFIYTKNNRDALKIRLCCHRWPDGCKSTAHFIDDNLSIMQKCDLGPEEQEAEKTSSHKEKLQPFSKINSTLEKRRKVPPPCKPKLCIVDFETALYPSILFTFECCYFHYRQALRRKWTQLGLSGQDTRQINNVPPNVASRRYIISV